MDRRQPTCSNWRGPGWSLELRSALRRCIETGRPVEQDRALLVTDGKVSPLVRLIVEPLPGPATDPLFMVVFVETSRSGRPAGGPTAGGGRRRSRTE